MATITNTTVTITDDINGKEGASTVLFGLDGKNYTIDLTPENEATLRKALAKFVKAATEVVPAPARTARTRRTSAPRGRGNTDTAAIRSWAQANGIPVGTRGRIDSEVVEAYNAAQAPTETDTDVAVRTAKALAVLHDEEIAAAPAE